MAKFTLEISCDNAAFEDDAGQEIANILARVGSAVLVHNLGVQARSDWAALYDSNGNRVGAWDYAK